MFAVLLLGCCCCCCCSLCVAGLLKESFRLPIHPRTTRPLENTEGSPSLSCSDVAQLIVHCFELGQVPTGMEKSRWHRERDECEDALSIAPGGLEVPTGVSIVFGLPGIFNDPNRQSQANQFRRHQ